MIVSLNRVKARDLHRDEKSDVIITRGEFEVCARMMDGDKPIGYCIGAFMSDTKWHNFLVSTKVVEDAMNKEKTDGTVL